MDTAKIINKISVALKDCSTKYNIAPNAVQIKIVNPKIRFIFNLLFFLSVTRFFCFNKLFYVNGQTAERLFPQFA